MAVDNPSYFSLQGGSSNSVPRSFGGLFRRKSSGSKIVASVAAPRSAVVPKSPVPSSSSSSSSSQRRSFRSLFRSASASADCEKTRQFLKGEPRPSDVAPPSPYLGDRCHGRGGEGRKRAGSKGGGARGPKSPNELLNMDMVFFGLQGPEAGPRRTEDNDYYHFERDSECETEAASLTPCADHQPSYYNLTGTLPSSSGSPAYSSMGRRKQHQQEQQRRARRHSIGTFLDRDKSGIATSATASMGSRDELEANSTRDASDCSVRYDRYGTRHAQTSFGSKPAEAAAAPARDDVIFISSKDNEASALWVNYLTACFEQISRQQGRPPFRVSQVSIEEPLAAGAEQRIRSSRLQIVVVCPVLLDRVAERPEQASCISRQLSPERVLAMMLGVQDGQLSPGHRASLVAYHTWRKFFVKDQDETFVGQFLGAAVAILANVQTNSLNSDKTAFSVHPKKVKIGHNRILAVLNEPLHPDDSVSVTVDRCGEAIELSHVKRRNPYTLQFSIPERCLDVSMLVGVRLARNGAPLGVRQVKCESRLRELDQILRANDNPLEFMCQTFGFNSGDKEQLDNWMVHAFQKNIPPHFNLLSNPPGDLQLAKNHSSSEENPTLLHFAARFGLEKLAWQLLECPGGDIACDMRNANDMTPADLAEQASHVRLAHQLRGYMQMNEFSNMYSYLKVMSENTNGNANGYRGGPGERLQTMAEEEPSRHQQQEDYCRPRPMSEAYSVPPLARPVTLAWRTFPDYATPQPHPQPTDELACSGSSTPTPLATYSSTSTLNASSLELPLQGAQSPDSTISTPSTALNSSQILHQCSNPETPTTDSSRSNNEAAAAAAAEKSSLGRSSSKSSCSREEPQDELLEIITDFKNNVFTISEVERLVENWRNRNDVQQSFKDKQRQLCLMRDEYERIQKRMKEEMKAPTPFDRIRKFFTKGKKDAKEAVAVGEAAAPSKQNTANGHLADRRPVSSLSLHSVSSSTSSGRMSTVSGCSGASLGDSGTHSDTDDRRQQQQQQQQPPQTEAQVAGMTNYEIPPAPKPCHGRFCQQQAAAQATQAPMSCRSIGNSELDLRPVKSSVPATDDKEYYIAFPPSGLPIHSFVGNGSSNSKDSRTGASNESRCPKPRLNYANVASIMTPPPGMCIPFEYMNVKSTQPEPRGKLLTIQPEIHAEPTAAAAAAAAATTSLDESPSENDDNESTSSPEPESPKILNTDHELAATTTSSSNSNLPDYTNVQLAASEQIARNFGVTLKRLPAPPVPPRCEFNFTTAADNSEEPADE